MLKRITVETLSTAGHVIRSFSIVVFDEDFRSEPPDELGGMLQIADEHHRDPLARRSLINAANVMARRLTAATGRKWSPQEVVQIR